MAPVRMSLKAALDDLEQQFDLSTEDLNAILRRFRDRMDYGLKHDGQDMAMIPSFVTGVPDGTEQGTYLALDLGGTNLRVCEVILDGKGSFKITQEKYKVSDELKTGKAKDLFLYIAKSVEHFLQSKRSLQPVEQTAIDRGTLIKWTKGFSAPDAVGQEVVGLLQGCLDELGVKVRVNCLVNDTVGALLAHGYQSRGPALLGAIFGTGTNGAYLEDRKKILKLEIEDPLDPKPQTMIINAEWGGFDDERNILPITTFDNVVDRTAIRPRLHAFEKMISGMYLGELSRMVILHLVDSLLILQGYSSPKMNEQYAFDTAYMSAIMQDTSSASEKSSESRKVLIETMQIPANYVSDDDVEAVRRICHFVGRRAARLSAIAVAAVVQHRSGSSAGVVNVGVDGSVVEFLPKFTERLREALAEMLGKDVEKGIKFGLAKDGSGVGAALCALQAQKQQKGPHHPHLKAHEASS